MEEMHRLLHRSHLLDRVDLPLARLDEPRLRLVAPPHALEDVVGEVDLLDQAAVVRVQIVVGLPLEDVTAVLARRLVEEVEEGVVDLDRRRADRREDREELPDLQLFLPGA